MGDVSTEPTMEEILSSIKRVIEESETATPVKSARRAVPTRPNAPVPSVGDRDDETDDEVLELSERVPFPDVPRHDPDPLPKAETILSAGAAQASRGSLETLSRMVVKPDVAGADTLEGMVREMLRPMLRDWLDAQLPQIVETMVAKEIARISGRGL